MDEVLWCDYSNKTFFVFFNGNILRNKNLKFCWILTMFTFEIENDNKTTELTAWKLGEGDRSRLKVDRRL